MNKAAIVLIVLSVIVVAFVVLRPEEPAPAPVSRDDVTIRATSTGEVVGFIGDHGARTWLGIPFAKPPLGNLRWRAPQPPEPWTGVREALAVGNLCPQMASLLSGEPFRALAEEVER